MAARTATVIVKTTDLEEFAELIRRLVKIHSPEETEAEFWPWDDNDDGAEHKARFPDCPGTSETCDGHLGPVVICSECGYDHDGEYARFRLWPCPTIKALGPFKSGEATA